MNSPEGSTQRDLEARGSPVPRRTHTLPNMRSEEDLRNQIARIDGESVEHVAILSFRALQLHRIAKLQAELVEKQKTAMTANTTEQGVGKDPAGKECQCKCESSKVDNIIQRYADAVRNYETLTQVIRFDEDIEYKFLGSTQNFRVKRRHEKSRWETLDWFAEGGATILPSDVGPLGFRELDNRGQKRRSVKQAFQSRLHMALLGGAALIVPVVIMALHPGVVLNLVVASVATILFAIATVALGSDASGKDVLSSTAAYAAVMVVFVGTSLQTLDGNQV